MILQTKLANPHYKPEMQAQATLINFTVTPDGLEDQPFAEAVLSQGETGFRKKQGLNHCTCIMYSTCSSGEYVHVHHLHCIPVQCTEMGSVYFFRLNLHDSKMNSRLDEMLEKLPQPFNMLEVSSNNAVYSRCSSGMREDE